MIKNVYRSSCKVPVIPVRHQCNLNFLDTGLENITISNFIKIRPVTDEFLADGRTDGRTDGQKNNDEGKSCVRQLCERTKKRKKWANRNLHIYILD